MLHSVFERTLHDQRQGLIGWLVGTALYGVMIVAVFPSIRDNPAFGKVIESYPEAFKAMFGIRDFQSGVGFLHGELFSLMVPLLFAIYALLAGSDATSGEEERRTIDLLLANPVARWRVVVEKFAAIVAATALMGAALVLTIVAVGALVSLHVSVVRLTVATAASVLLASGFGALALLVGAATGRRGLARGVAAAFAVGTYLVSSLSSLVTGLKPWRPISPWWHAVGVEPLRNGLGLVDALVLVVGTLVLAAVAAWAFERRDLAV